MGIETMRLNASTLGNLRKTRNLTLAGLANASGLSVACLNRICKGAAVKPCTIRKIARGLGMPFEDMRPVLADLAEDERDMAMRLDPKKLLDVKFDRLLSTMDISRASGLTRPTVRKAETGAITSVRTLHSILRGLEIELSAALESGLLIREPRKERRLA